MLSSTDQVAKRLEITPRAVRALALRHNIGTLVTPRSRVFTDEDVERLRAISTGKVGRPRRATT